MAGDRKDEMRRSRAALFNRLEGKSYRLREELKRRDMIPASITRLFDPSLLDITQPDEFVFDIEVNWYHLLFIKHVDHVLLRAQIFFVDIPFVAEDQLSGEAVRRKLDEGTSHIGARPSAKRSKRAPARKK